MKNLPLEPHVNNIVRLAYMKLKMLYRFKNSLSAEIKFNLIQSLIYPIIDYCLPVYYNHLTQYNKYKL